jgi:hypothetical protein
MVRDDLLMTGDTSFAAKHFDELVTNALGSTGTPVSDSYLAESGCSAFVYSPTHSCRTVYWYYAGVGAIVLHQLLLVLRLSRGALARDTAR